MDDAAVAFQQRMLVGKDDLALGTAGPSGPGDSNTRAVRREAKTFDPATEPFCDLFPDSCKPPRRFDCNTEGEDSLGRLMNDTSNWRWCWSNPRYLNYTTSCQRGHLKKASDFLYNAHMAVGNLDILHGEAQYCFAAGHCDNHEVTQDSTSADNQVQCDKLYTRSGWKGINPTSMAMRPDHRGQYNAWGKVACDLGLFHCDIFYCQDHFCSNSSWSKLYGYLALPTNAEVQKEKENDKRELDLIARVLRILSQ